MIDLTPPLFDYPWWDDAVAAANQMARDTELRQKVTWTGACWRVDLASRQRPTLVLVAEVCS